MKTIFEKIINLFRNDTLTPKSEEDENEEIISAYSLIKRSVPDYNEPNYELAKKVFLDFNDFNLFHRIGV